MADERVLILVAEDYPPFQEFVCRELARRQDFEVVAVADGTAAVQKAEELQPAVILLDIGMPGMNGLAAAREIHARSPKSRVVFLTQESSADVVLEAIRMGARGYIDKTRARYLLPVTEAIADNPPVLNGDGAGGHQIQFYLDDAVLLDSMERFLGTALAAGGAAVAIATNSHIASLVDRLRTWDTNIDRTIDQGRLTLIDVNEVTSRAIADGVPQALEYLAGAMDPAFEFTKKSGRRTAAFGECSALLIAAGHLDAALEIEKGANEMVQSLPIDIMCGCPLPPFDRVAEFKSLCAQHMAVAVR